jgi:hypothetical protein
MRHFAGSRYGAQFTTPSRPEVNCFGASASRSQKLNAPLGGMAPLNINSGAVGLPALATIGPNERGTPDNTTAEDRWF